MNDHAQAVEQFVVAARCLPPEHWERPPLPGQWSPAEITSHLDLTYQVLRAELTGAAGMRLLGSPLRRWLLRHTVMSKILRGQPFPPGARAPREIRPGEIHDDAAIGLTALAAEAEAFSRELTARAASGPVHLTHAYFGQLSARQSLVLVSVHTRHHTRQIAAALG
jgi:DinB superfamily